MGKKRKRKDRKGEDMSIWLDYFFLLTDQIGRGQALTEDEQDFFDNGCTNIIRVLMTIQERSHDLRGEIRGRTGNV